MPASRLSSRLLVAVIGMGTPCALPAQHERIDALRERFLQQVHQAPDSALRTAEEHMRLALAAGDRKRMARSNAMLGQAWRLKGHPDKAMYHFHQALTGMDAVGDAYSAAMLHGNIANVHLAQGQWDAAARHARASVSGFERIGQSVWAGAALHDLAVALVGLGQDDSARVLLARSEKAMDHAALQDHTGHLRALREGLDAEALDNSTDEGPRSVRIRAKLAMARAMDATGLDHRAAEAIREVLAEATAGGFDEEAMEAHHLSALLFEESGDTEKALVHYKSFMALKDSIASQYTAVAIAELQQRFEGARKDATLQAQQATIARQRAWLVGSVAGVVLLATMIGILLLWRRREREHLFAMGRRNAALDAALAGKELLLQEVHHRVKNNLQMVGSLLRMQGRSISDAAAREAVRDSQDRVQSMALIHQDLYLEDDPRGIGLKHYVERLAGGLLKSHGIVPGRIDLRVEVEDIRLDVDTAIPIGLILNELIVNALKHAFPNGRQGTLMVTLRRDAGVLLLEVKDDGIGHHAALDPGSAAPGFGMGMLRTFAEKLGAEHEMNGHSGTAVRMRIRNFKITT